VQLARRAVEEYRETQRVRLDPLGLSLVPSEPQDGPSDGARVVLFGDSRARGWPAPRQAPGFAFVNRGIGGETSAQAVLRFPLHAASLAPRVVVVQVGVNDLRLVSLLPGRRDEIVESVAGNVRRIVAEIRALGAIAVVSTVFPIGAVPLAARPFFSPSRIAQAIDEVNRRIRSLAAEDVRILDADPLLAGADGRLAPGYANDWLHLSRAGYDVLNRELVRILEDIAAP
jgi:lysophospholipase L1-like esterase